MNGIFFCNKCGAQNTAGAQFCSRCGAPTSVATAPPPVPGSGPASVPYYPSPAYPGAVPVAGFGYGGFWIRVVAAIIDSIIVGPVAVLFLVFFGGLSLAGIMHGVHPLGLAVLGAARLVFFFGSWLYEALMESSSYQATLGKMALGLKVTDLYGNRISFGRATGRHFAKWLSLFVFCIGYIMVGFTERKQGLHDLLAGTLVRRS
jgi:uncharacterized RDD family membrane protein YckC